MDILNSVVQQRLDILFVHPVQEGQHPLELLLGFDRRLRNCQHAGETGSRKRMQLSVCSCHPADDIHIVAVRLVGAFLLECGMNFVVKPCSVVHHVDNDTGFVVDDRIIPFGAVHHCEVGVDQLLVVQLFHKFKRFQILGIFMLRNQLPILNAPFVR
ncbi:hypothetical protein D3C75_832930 [compost metagenome]